MKIKKYSIGYLTDIF